MISVIDTYDGCRVPIHARMSRKYKNRLISDLRKVLDTKVNLNGMTFNQCHALTKTRERVVAFIDALEDSK